MAATSEAVVAVYKKDRLRVCMVRFWRLSSVERQTASPDLFVIAEPLAIDEHAESQCDAAFAILQENSAPLSTQELMAAAQQRGIKVGGTNPATNFSSALSRDTRFKNVPWNASRKWWLSGVDLPTDPAQSETERTQYPTRFSVSA